jgi:hypothetical protein
MVVINAAEYIWTLTGFVLKYICTHFRCFRPLGVLVVVVDSDTFLDSFKIQQIVRWS